MSQEATFRKCFTCFAKTENKKTRRRGYAKSFCRLFSLPNLPYEDELVEGAVFCKMCHENIRQIELLYRKLEKVKEEIINFRVLLENQLTQNVVKTSQPDSHERKLENNADEISTEIPVSDPSEELRGKIIGKIQFSSAEDEFSREKKTDPISSEPVTTLKGNGNENNDDETVSDNLDEANDESIKKEVDWTPHSSPVDSFLQDDDDDNDHVHKNRNERGDTSEDDDSDSDFSDNLNAKEQISKPIQSCVYPRRTTRSQTALIKNSDIKVEKENSCDESDEMKERENSTPVPPSTEVNNAISLEERNRHSRKTRIKHEKSIRKAIAESDEADLVDFKRRKKKMKQKQKKIQLEKLAGYLACPIENCKRRFPDDTARTAHVKRFHEGVKKPYVCPESNCGKTYKYKSELEQHGLFHVGIKPFMCEFCAKTFPTKNLLKNHTRNIHSKDFPLKCQYCNKGFKCNSILEVHLRKHTKDYPFVCDCGKRFSTLPTLKMHKRAHNEEFKCSHCGRSLSNQNSLDDHILTHTREYKYKCPQPQCDFGANHRSRLRKHISTHSGTKVECPICKKKVTESSMTSHMKVHDPERPKKCICQHCGKAFVDNYKLKRHEQYHKGDKPFQCSVCGKSFYTRDYLNIHMKYHEKSGVELRNQTRKPRVWKHSVLPNPCIDPVLLADSTPEQPTPIQPDIIQHFNIVNQS